MALSIVPTGECCQQRTFLHKHFKHAYKHPNGSEGTLSVSGQVTVGHVKPVVSVSGRSTLSTPLNGGSATIYYSRFVSCFKRVSHPGDIIVGRKYKCYVTLAYLNCGSGVETIESS